MLLSLSLRWRDGLKVDGLVDISGFARSVILKHPSRSYLAEKMLHLLRCARFSKVRRHTLRIPVLVIHDEFRSHG